MPTLFQWLLRIASGLIGLIVLEGLPLPPLLKGILTLLLPPAMVLWVFLRTDKLRRIFSVILDQTAADEGWQKVGEEKAAAPVNNAASTIPPALVYAPEWFSTWNCCDTF